MELVRLPPPMDDRLLRRRRSVRWERSRGRRAALFLAALLLCCLIAFLCLRATDVFAVTRVTVTGTDKITREQLASITAGAMGESLLSLSTVGMKEQLLALPCVESVRVARAFPNTLEISLVEHTPVARLRTEEGRTWLVTSTGRALEDKDPALLPDLPLLTTEAAPRSQTESSCPRRSLMLFRCWSTYGARLRRRGYLR